MDERKYACPRCGAQANLEIEARVVRRRCTRCPWLGEAPRYPEDDCRCEPGPDGRLRWRTRDGRPPPLR